MRPGGAVAAAERSASLFLCACPVVLPVGRVLRTLPTGRTTGHAHKKRLAERSAAATAPPGRIVLKFRERQGHARERNPDRASLDGPLVETSGVAHHDLVHGADWGIDHSS